MKRNRAKGKPGSRKTGGGAPAPPPAAPAVPLPSRRRWAYRILTVAILPALALLLLEAVLRIAGYGYRTGFFEPFQFGEKQYFADNPTFSLRFFPPQLARSPGPSMFEAQKPAGTYRIFVLGESAARGEPEPPFGPARFLEALLEDRYPGTPFEVINTAMTAINSHVILPIARDCARQNGDLWILYIGNNEMVGPFGAATVFGAHAPPLWSVRLGLAVQRTRIGQGLMSEARALHGKPAIESWGGMQMFLANQLPPDDPAREIVYGSFRENLHDVVRAGIDSGAKVVLSTVAVNLQDCPPFASFSATNLPPATIVQFGPRFQDACRAQEQGRFEKAAELFDQANQTDSRSAELQYRWGQCLLQLTNDEAAREHFQKACDLDTLPFRATSRINEIVSQTGRQFSGSDLILLDAAADLATNSPAGLPGRDLFWEHVHFTFDGSYRLGLAWAQAAARLLPESVTRGARPQWADRQECERRLGLSDWNRCAVVESVMWRVRRPPMSTQLNSLERLAALQVEDRDLRSRMNDTNAVSARGGFGALLQKYPDDHFLYENYAEFLESTGDRQDALTQWRRVCDLLPHNGFGYYQVGRLLNLRGQGTAAEPPLRRAVELRPSLADAWFELGNLYLSTDRLNAARDAFERAQRLEPRDPVTAAYLGRVMSKLNRHEEAIRLYQQALDLKPDMVQARLALGDELVTVNRLTEAEHEYSAVVQQEPTNWVARMDWGVMLARRGQFDPALEQFSVVLEQEPQNTKAREYLARVQEWKSHRH